VARRFAEEVGRGGAGVPVGFSIGKSRAVPVDSIDAVIADYLASFRAVRRVADFVVVNVSSPNTKGLRALQGADMARALLTALARDDASPRVPLLLKVSPDLSEDELASLLDVVADVKLDGVVATNTTLSRGGLATPPEVVKEIGAGGLSGPPLSARVLEVLPRVRRRLGPAATIIAVGGVTDADDVRRCMAAGADLVQLYTSFIYEGPGLPYRLAAELAGRAG
jgi:dihydroorotate dehydrogenase